MHAAVGAFWLARDGRHSVAQPFKPAQWTEAAYAALRSSWDAEGIEAPTYSLAMGERMLDRYIAQAKRVGPFTDVADDWQVVSIEERAVLPVSQYKLSFQLDRAYYSPSQDRVAIIDLKTVSRPDMRWRSSWYRSLQMKLYRYGTMRYYDQANVDVVIEGLDKSAKPDIHYIQLPQWSESLLREAVATFESIAARDEALLQSVQNEDGTIHLSAASTLIERALNDTVPNYHDCTSYGSTCPFLPLCESEPEMRPALLAAEYVDVEQDY